MVRRFFSLTILALMISGCFPTKNIKNVVRFKSNRFKLKPNNNVNYLKLIDTSSFYWLVKVNAKDSILGKYVKDKKQGIKFYKGGRIAFFRNIKFSVIESFNPLNAEMGYYNYDENEFLIESVFPTPGNKFYLSRKKLTLISKDTIQIKTYKSPRGGNYITTYVRKSLKKEFLIYKPDW